MIDFDLETSLPITVDARRAPRIYEKPAVSDGDDTTEASSMTALAALAIVSSGVIALATALH